jgi:hypothetical protein
VAGIGAALLMASAVYLAVDAVFAGLLGKPFHRRPWRVVMLAGAVVGALLLLAAALRR